MSWSTRITNIDARFAQVLIDERFSSSAPVQQLPRLAWFGVYAKADPGGAFWHPDETASLNAIEDDLIRLCGKFGRGWVVYVLRLDTRGIREYFLYFGGSADMPSAFEHLRLAHPDYRIEYEEIADPSWRRYISCLPSSDPSSSQVQ
jgi:hypothetical protein